MAGLISSFLVTFIVALAISLGLVISAYREITAFFSDRKTGIPATPPPPAEQNENQLKTDPLRTLGAFLSLVFFSIGLWYVSFDFLHDIITTFKSAK